MLRGIVGVRLRLDRPADAALAEAVRVLAAREPE